MGISIQVSASTACATGTLPAACATVRLAASAAPTNNRDVKKPQKEKEPTAIEERRCRDHVGKDTQYLAVDKLGCYANPGETNGYQLSFDNEYLVQEGDTWRTIAAQHGLDPAKLADLNGGRRLKDPIWPGQYIRLR